MNRADCKQKKREPGNMANYEGPDSEGFYKCKTCGGDILAAEVQHQTYLTGTSLGGGSSPRYTKEPYCPNCEEEPDPVGEPFYKRAYM